MFTASKNFRTILTRIPLHTFVVTNGEETTNWWLETCRKLVPALLRSCLYPSCTFPALQLPTKHLSPPHRLNKPVGKTPAYLRLTPISGSIESENFMATHMMVGKSIHRALGNPRADVHYCHAMGNSSRRCWASLLYGFFPSSWAFSKIISFCV